MWWSGGDPESDSDTCTFTTHWDSPGTKTVIATPDCGDSKEKQVTVVKVHTVVEAGTTNEGPLYVVCPEYTVDLEAKPNPAARFPPGEPHWTIESQPGGADASLTPSSDSAIITLGNLTVAGDYIVNAKCGDSDAGDSITVTVVEVDRIEINYSGTSWDDVTEETIVVLKGTKYTFKAFPNPSTASWPTDQPDWYAEGGGTTRVDDGDETEVTFTSSGTKTLSAKCGGPGHCGTDPGKSVTINVVVPEPDQIYFVDYTIGEEHNIYNVTDPVWKRVSNPDDPACYTKNKHVRVRAKFWASENLTYNTQVYVDVAGVDWLTFTEDTSENFWSWPSESTFHNSDGLLEDTIGSTAPNFAWTYKVPSGTNQWIAMASDSGPHKIYRVLDTPTAPMGEPWTEVLDKSCDWADGKETEPDALHEVTSGLFGCNPIYDGVLNYTSGDVGNQMFNLTQWLSDYPWSDDEVGCVDMSNLVTIYGNALGADAQYLQKDGVPGNRVPGRFDTNYIKFVSKSSWIQYSLNNHQFAWADSKVYDASCQVDSDGHPESEPCTALLPTGLSEATYKSYLVLSGEDWITVPVTPAKCTVE